MRFALTVALAGLAQFFSTAAPIPEQPKMVPVDKDFDPPVCRGRVVAITETSVTLKPEGFARVDDIKFLPGGLTERKVYIQDNTKPQQTFVFNDYVLWVNGTLPAAQRAGKPPLAVRAPYEQHKISDVQLGDVIDIRCCTIQDVRFCSKIQIQRRPGGVCHPRGGTISGNLNTESTRDTMPSRNERK